MRSGAKRSKPSASLWSSAEDSSARSHSFRSSATLGVASASPRPALCRRSGGSRSSPRSSARISASRFDSSSIVDASCASLPVGRHEMKTIDLVSHSSLHTERLGERLGRAARPNDVFALSGELGTGKTVLARGIAIGLGIEASDISSPTFIIMREHGGGRLPFFHIDLYRLEGVDLANTGWEECLDAGGVTVIEWPDRAGPLLPDDRLAVAVGPGSFTGLRVAIAAGQGIARGNGAALVGISTLDVLAYPHAPSKQRTCPLLRAGRDTFYAAFYQERNRKWMRRSPF